MNEEEECDPSNFSFFEVPEFTSSNSDEANEQYFATRLKEIENMTRKANKGDDQNKKQNIVHGNSNQMINDTNNIPFANENYGSNDNNEESSMSRYFEHFTNTKHEHGINSN